MGQEVNSRRSLRSFLGMLWTGILCIPTDPCYELYLPSLHNKDGFVPHFPSKFAVHGADVLHQQPSLCCTAEAMGLGLRHHCHVDPCNTDLSW